VPGHAIATSSRLATSCVGWSRVPLDGDEYCCEARSRWTTTSNGGRAVSSSFGDCSSFFAIFR
jgi:hypothetical protein